MSETQMDLEDFGLNENCGPDNTDHRLFDPISKHIQNRQVQRDRGTLVVARGWGVGGEWGVTMDMGFLLKA